MKPSKTYCRKVYLRKYEFGQEIKDQAAASSNQTNVPNRAPSLKGRKVPLKPLKPLERSRLIAQLKYKEAYFRELPIEELPIKVKNEPLEPPQTTAQVAQNAENNPIPGQNVSNSQNIKPTLTASDNIEAMALPTPDNETTATPAVVIKLEPLN